jgi:starch synthase (maltosyl-transferring)
VNTKGKQRVIIENVKPLINCGQFPAKRVPGEEVRVSADIIADGHDAVQVVVQYKYATDRQWKEVAMRPLGNDRWEGIFRVIKEGTYQYRIVAWVDHLLSWHRDLKKRVTSGQQVAVELKIGSEYLMESAGKAKAQEKKEVEALRDIMVDESRYKEAVELALNAKVADLIKKFPLRKNETIYDQQLCIKVEHKKAMFSSWYEFFPRSTSGSRLRHGTFKDCEKVLPIIARMGFDTVYLPPIHPIGMSFRKGRNNSVVSEEGEPGSPWAIGAVEGGHKAIHPALGTLEDFHTLLATAKEHEIDVALDVAFQCSPDHPYVKEHPEWFRWRPDGTVQYAENPPKKYQDVLPINFESDDWHNLWIELKSVFEYWIEQGVTMFRVDNPHTKPFDFWEWLIEGIHKEHPRVIFLAEAFTRPKVMARLAKVGFTQSYTYFTWRNTKAEIYQYMDDLSNTSLREYFRPNFWPNTPDILAYNLQNAPYSNFVIRYILAATLSSNYGLYGPAYDFCVSDPYPGKEEYNYSEKYEIKAWEWFSWTPLRELMARVNYIRKTNEALQYTFNVVMCETDSESLLAFLKYSYDRTNLIYVVVNLDPHAEQSGWVRMPLDFVNHKEGKEMIMHDLISDERYTWTKEWNFVSLNPHQMPFHLFRITK